MVNNEIIKEDLEKLEFEDRKRFYYKPIKKGSRTYILGDIFGVVIEKGQGFTILEHPTPDLPGSWIIWSGLSGVDNYFLKDLSKVVKEALKLH